MEGFTDIHEITDENIQSKFEIFKSLNHQINLCDHTVEECQDAILNVLNF